jgi:adenylate cyclase
MGDNRPAMAMEIELKLLLPEAGQRRFLRHPVLKTALATAGRRLVNIYFDTPDLRLLGHGIALRLRRQGDQWLQTVKCSGQRHGALAARPEWETPYSGQFDFSVIDDARVRGFLDRSKVRATLMPIFETHFLRRVWSLPGLELVLDRGWIAAAGRREPISEVEIELVGDAQVGQLFALADQLSAHQLLLPAWQSKAERGYRLFRGEAAAPRRAAAGADFAADATPAAAFAAIATDCLAQMEANRAGTLAAADPEYLHQMRVAVRRLRACLRIFAPLLPADDVDALLPALRELMQALGQGRDLDVLQTESLAPLVATLPDDPRLAALLAAVDLRRQAAHAVISRQLDDAAHGRLLLALTALLQPGDDAAAGTLEDFARARLRRLGRRLRRLARAATPGDASGLHAMRIAVKRLRYALEFFQPLLRRRERRLARCLADIQETLGQINDLATADRLLAAIAGGDPALREAAALAGGWNAERRVRLHALVPAVIEDCRRLAS